MPARSTSVPGIVFAVPPATDELQHGPMLAALSAYLTTRIGISVVASRAVSYDDLASTVSSGLAHAAWLPPALFVELDRAIGMKAVAAAERGAGVGYYCAFFTLIDSDVASITEIPGHSVGWVDPSSAAGYVYPRLQLAALGIDPSTAFQEEVFFRSHSAVVRAVSDRAVDIGATFVHLDPAHPRKVIRAGWRPPPSGVDPSTIQWLEPFGPLPPDVIAVRSDVPTAVADAIGNAFMAIHDQVEEIRHAARRHFGTGRFVEANSRAYDLLRRAMDAAEGKGVDALASLRPSEPV
ncbi:MAG: PhnD/SsuA/transferrin family substrate-binding protein [Deltaproteobacteria bacterium]|nr:PhnD/SsuA/transferrin family substrate-binding protein [Deltaproteobacteria bacterium]